MATCSIIRNSLGEVLGVNAPNGKPSNLFSKAYEFFSDKTFKIGEVVNPNDAEFENEVREKAADIVGFVNSSEFKDYVFENEDIQRDMNGEPLLSEVLGFIRNKTKININNDHRLALSNLSNFEDGVTRFKEAFIDLDGNFTIDYDKLKRSGIFTDIEIMNFMSNPPSNLEGIVRNIEDLVIDSIVGSQSESIKVVGEFDALGFQRSVPIKDLVKEMLSEGDINDVVNFEEAVNKLPKALKEVILNDADIYDKLFNRVVNVRKYPIKTIENGSIVDKLSKDVFTELKETLLIDGDTKNILSNIQTLLSLDYDVLMNNSDIVSELLDETVLDLLDFNIDITEFSKRFEELDVTDSLEFLQNLGNLIYAIENNYVSDTDIQSFADAYNDYFGVDNDFVVGHVDDFINKNVVKIQGKITDIEAFNQGYVRLKDDLYTKIDKSENYDTLVDNITQAYFENGIRMIPQVTKSTNESKFKENIKSYVVSNISQNLIDKMGAEEAMLFKLWQLLVDSDIKNDITDLSFTQEDVEVANERYSFVDKHVDEDYVDNFNSSFQQLKLQEKFKGSDLYNKVLKNTEITEKGVVFTDEDSKYSLQMLETTDPVINTLKDMHRVEVSNDEVNYFDETQKSAKYAFNNFEQVFEVSNDYVLNGEVLTMNNIFDEMYVKLNNDLYFMTDYGVYHKLDKDKVFGDSNSFSSYLNGLSNNPKIFNSNEAETSMNDGFASTRKVNEMLECK